MKYFLALITLSAVLFSTACSQSSEKLLAAANRYHEKQKFKEASILYQKAILKDKTNAEAYYRQGINLVDQHDLGEAAKYFRRAVDLKPENTDAAAKLAEIYLGAYASDTKKYKNLLPEIQDLDKKILDHQPDSFDGIRLKGLLELAQNNRDQAIQTFAKANQIRPHSRALVGWYAQALMAAQRPQEAENLVRDMIAHDKTWGPGYDFLVLNYSRQNDRAKAEQVLRQHVASDPANSAAIVALANFLYATNRADEAESTMKRVLNDRKDFPNGREIVGDFYIRTRKFDAALDQYKNGLNEDPKNTTSYQRRMAAVYQVMGKNAEATQLTKSLVEKDPKDLPSNEMYAALLLQTQSKTELANGIATVKKMSATNPEDSMLHLELARAYLRQGEPDKSLPEAVEAITNEGKTRTPRPIVALSARAIAAEIYVNRGDNTKALDQTDAILAADPRNPQARFIQDRALIGINQPEKAQADLEALVQEQPKMNDAHIQLANVFLAQRQYEKAKAEFQKVWNSDPPDNRGLVGLQTVKLAQGKGDEAIASMQELAEKNSSIPGYRYQLATMQATVGAQSEKANRNKAKQLYEQAIENYKEVLKSNPKSADLWLRIGSLQRQDGQYDAALTSFKQAASVDPSNASAVLNQAILLQALGRKQEASAAYNKVLGIDGENALALNNLAFMTAEEGANLDQAMTFAERAKKRVPNNPDISDTLGFVYYQKNLNAEALRIFRQVVQDNPQNATFHLHLAMALLKQGDREAARSEAQKALRNASQPEEQNKIKSFVNQIG